VTTLSTPASSDRQAALDPALRDSLLATWPRLGWQSFLIVLGIVLIYWWSLTGTNVSLGELARGIPNIFGLLGRMLPPRFAMDTVVVGLPFGASLPYFGQSIAVTLPEVIPSIFQTVQMAIIGTTLGILLSIPFGLLAARNTSPHPLVYQGTRLFLNSARAIPGLIFALIFVASVGLGPFAGVLAIAIGEIGVLGKLFGEAIEAIDPQQVQAVRATGARPLQVFVYSVLPQALPVATSYSLLVFEGNVRNATILGIVGAGGVGFILSKYMALFQYQLLTGALILILLTVTVIDRFSDYIRRKLI
jgi:phosphonate transport system permease protein